MSTGWKLFVAIVIFFALFQAFVDDSSVSERESINSITGAAVSNEEKQTTKAENNYQAKSNQEIETKDWSEIKNKWYELVDSAGDFVNDVAPTVQNIADEVLEEFNIEPTDKDALLSAFDKINNLRSQYGKNQITWNDDLFNLAVTRSKDMYDQNYFDHVNPQGECANSMKDSYGLDGYTLAENAGAMYEGYSEYDMQYALSIDEMEQVDGWMDSRGHRYNLLYDDHVIGAMGCYHGACIFLGGHTNDYGLGGGGGCYSGAEGQAYWDNAGKQPGEI